jgi:hypothetical protein
MDLLIDLSERGIHFIDGEPCVVVSFLPSRIFPLFLTILGRTKTAW